MRHGLAATLPLELTRNWSGREELRRRFAGDCPGAGRGSCETPLSFGLTMRGWPLRAGVHPVRRWGIIAGERAASAVSGEPTGCARPGLARSPSCPGRASRQQCQRGLLPWHRRSRRPVVGARREPSPRPPRPTTGSLHHDQGDRRTCSGWWQSAPKRRDDVRALDGRCGCRATKPPSGSGATPSPPLREPSISVGFECDRHQGQHDRHGND